MKIARSFKRRQLLASSGVGILAFVAGNFWGHRTASAVESSLSPADMWEIQQLNSRYFYTLDALTEGDTAQAWADTFTPNGTFALLEPNGSVVLSATGTEKLIEAYNTFPDVQTTRHWMNNLTIEPDGEGARTGCYIIAMNIKMLPASIERSGLYKDDLVKVNGAWKYQNRTLILDPDSPAG